VKRRRVLLADDHTLLLEAFQALLEPSYEVVATVTDGQALLVSAPLFQPDVVILDIAMPLLNGLDAGRRLKQKMPQVKLVYLTMNSDPDLASEAIRAGASAYLLKSSASSELFHAVEEVLKGRSYITKQIARAMQESFIRDPRSREHAKVPTVRQREVIQLVAEGKSMKQVADVLNLTPRTVAFHKYRAMECMGCKSTAELIQFAVKNHIVGMG
jgi:DNA-binding NarL/FixJ family response regulator